MVSATLSFAAVIFGLLLGMVVNYLADTIPIERRISEPFCRVCGAKLPIVNYLLWPRRCLNCGAHRGARIWIVEIALGAAAFLLMNFGPQDLGFGWGITLLAFLVLVTVIDLEHRLILHSISLVGLALGAAIGVMLHGPMVTLLGGIAGFCTMLLMYYLGFLFLKFSRKIRGHDISEVEAIGFGDVVLSGVIGLILGWPGIVLGLVFAILIAGITSLFYLLWTILRKGYNPNLALPYGPFLTISAAVLIYLRPLFQ
jgi:leader peptidase (prepilin peptidase)/N-methyltransferase